MSVAGIHGHPLEVTVVSCTDLKDKEWFSRQDPYVCVQYAASKFKTRTCTDGGKNPVFQETFTITLIEGLRELQIAVWKSNTISRDDFIGSGSVLLDKVLREGYDDSSWVLQSKSGRHHGYVCLTLYYANAKKSTYPPSYVPPTAPFPPFGAPTPNAYNGSPAHPRAFAYPQAGCPPPHISMPDPTARYPYPPPYHSTLYHPTLNPSVYSAPPPSTAYTGQPSYPPSSTYPSADYPPHSLSISDPTARSSAYAPTYNPVPCSTMNPVVYTAPPPSIHKHYPPPYNPTPCFTMNPVTYTAPPPSIHKYYPPLPGPY